MIVNNWRGYDVNIKHRSDKFCRIELFNNSKQHFINLCSANPSGLRASEINKNIYHSIKKEGSQW
jgi:hypothetical protein|tara:strand:+ start:159 stop:353 length:195 start_codon:yes stop_codon:yes gene_type:complete